MKCLLALLPLAINVLAGTKDDEGPGILVHGGEPVQFRVYCDTTDGSPLLHHVYEVADQVHTGRDDECYQSNPAKSHCTKINEGAGGRISICGPDEERYDIPCGDVAIMARAVGDHCARQQADGQRAGGHVYREFITFTSWAADPPAWVEVSTKP